MRITKLLCLLTAIEAVGAVALLAIMAGVPDMVTYETEEITLSSDASSTAHTYKFNCNGTKYILRLDIPDADYQSALQSDHGVSDTQDYWKFVDSESALVKTLAESLDSLSDDAPTLILRFVQSLNYIVDVDSTGIVEYPRYPVETLYAGGGDCEDTAILYASLMQALGYDVCLLHTYTNTGTGHVLTGISGAFNGNHATDNDGTVYYLAETTEYSRIGQIPFALVFSASGFEIIKGE